MRLSSSELGARGLSQARLKAGRVGGWLCAAVLALGTGCDDGASSKGAPSASAVVDLSPVPAPAAHLADIAVAAPSATWERLRALAGPGAALLPSSFPVLVTTLTGLPPTVSSSVDAKVPVHGALVEVGEAELAVVIGVHVRSGRELIAASSRGADARFDAKPDTASGVTELIAKNPGKDATLGLGVIGNYLLIASRREALTLAGPYVARTLPGSPPAKEPIVVTSPKEVLSGTLAKRIREVWKKRREQLEAADVEARKQRDGRAPDFGDPAAAVLGIDGAVSDLAAILEGAEVARLVVRPEAAHLEAELSVVPKATGEAKTLVDEMVVGPLTALGALPRDTAAALFSQSTAAGRAESAKASEESFAKLLGERLPEADRKRLGSALTALAAGRGDHVALFLARSGVPEDRELSVFLRGGVTDAAELSRGIREARALLQLPAFAEPIREFIGPVKTQLGKGKADGVTPAPDRIAIELLPKATAAGKAPALKVESRRFEFLWRAAPEHGFQAVLAQEAGPALSRLVRLTEQDSLAAQPSFATQLERAKLEATFAALVQPNLLGSAQGKESAVLVVFGRREGQATLRVDIDQLALQSTARLFLRR
ncbi:MAG: hypothetical protein KIT72_09960 [Polyangiaceae bacterium]|nr:hypothetical protein [Polyangiaceae bacterium]MCW5790734.1 hypothetical protein [Polyangiaceae bacterium]